MVKLFGSNKDVSFGDVNLSESSVRSSHGTSQSPGAGGWPTVRYFNKATGYGGAPYARAASPILMVLGLLLVHVVLWVAVVPCGCCRCMWDQDEEEQEGQEDKKKGD